MEIKESAPLRFNIYNQNYTNKLINILSKDLDKHTGIISYSKTDLELDKEIDVFFNSENKVGIIRLILFDVKEFMYKSFTVNDKKRMYLEYLSLNQFQTEIIDVPLYEIIKDIEFEIPSKKNADILLLREDSNYILGRSVNYKRLCFIIENTSSSIRTVNLLQENFIHGFNDESINIEVPINDFDNNEVISTELIRCFTRNSTQLRGDINCIKDNDNFRIEQSKYMSNIQFQDIGVDINVELDINFGGKFEINLLPNTKVMYIFYAK